MTGGGKRPADESRDQLDSGSGMVLSGSISLHERGGGDTQMSWSVWLTRRCNDPMAALAGCREARDQGTIELDLLFS